jgi:anti-sigma28 factor (negative regulator of flagellin synthesis)
MGGIQGIGGVPEPKPDRPAGAKDNPKTDPSGTASPSGDDIVISSEAQAAATVAKTIQASQVIPDVRADRIAEAKEAIERGDFRKPEIVQVVADRISKFIE